MIICSVCLIISQYYIAFLLLYFSASNYPVYSNFFPYYVTILQNLGSRARLTLCMILMVSVGELFQVSKLGDNQELIVVL